MLYMRMSSGGGYGDPLEREAERVLNDVEDGIVSRDDAQEIYGVVIEGDELVLDLAATDELRVGLTARAAPGDEMKHPLRANLEIDNFRRDGMGSLQQVSTQPLLCGRGLAASSVKSVFSADKSGRD